MCNFERTREEIEMEFGPVLDQLEKAMEAETDYQTKNDLERDHNSLYSRYICELAWHGY